VEHGRSERIVLWWNLPDEIIPHDRQFGKDIFSYFGDLAEEEKSEDAGGGSETGCYAATIWKRY
jgi:hypothetical protein